MSFQKVAQREVSSQKSSSFHYLSFVYKPYFFKILRKCPNASFWAHVNFITAKKSNVNAVPSLWWSVAVHMNEQCFMKDAKCGFA